MTAVVYGPYVGRIIEVHDGDTVYMNLDLGFGVQMASHDIKGRLQLACRVQGINAPELKVNNFPNQPGIDALEFAKTLLPVGLIVTVFSHSWDKYGGRFDGDIILPDGRDFADVMYSNGKAVLM